MIIAFAGYKGSGKSEAVNTLMQLGFTDVKMAAPLKQMLAAMYQYCGLTHEQVNRRLEGDLKEQPDEWLIGQTPRHAMQQLGTEWRNSIHTSLWIPMWQRRVRMLKPNPVCCSDVRFPHEVDALRAVGGRLIWIDRPGTHSDGHASEQDIRHLADETITNDHDVNTLRSAVRRIALGSNPT
jgi:hypothetical protein